MTRGPRTFARELSLTEAVASDIRRPPTSCRDHAGSTACTAQAALRTFFSRRNAGGSTLRRWERTELRSASIEPNMITEYLFVQSAPGWVSQSSLLQTIRISCRLLPRSSSQALLDARSEQCRCTYRDISLRHQILRRRACSRSPDGRNPTVSTVLADPHRRDHVHASSRRFHAKVTAHDPRVGYRYSHPRCTSAEAPPGRSRHCRCLSIKMAQPTRSSSCRWPERRLQCHASPPTWCGQPRRTEIAHAREVV